MNEQNPRLPWQATVSLAQNLAALGRTGEAQALLQALSSGPTGLLERSLLPAGERLQVPEMADPRWNPTTAPPVLGISLVQQRVLPQEQPKDWKTEVALPKYHQLMMQFTMLPMTDAAKATRYKGYILRDLNGHPVKLNAGAPADTAGALYQTVQAILGRKTPAPRTDNEKLFYVFPSDGKKFTSESQAGKAMKTVQVSVWVLDKDKKTKISQKMSLRVNQNLADDVQRIFREIFEHPSQPLINPQGTYGYSFRLKTSGKGLSHHSFGTAIDIYPTGNFYEVWNGKNWVTVVGSHHETDPAKPNFDPYSIPKGGVVDNIFAKYGWSRGLWKTQRDYMHYTYLGE